MSAPDDQNKKDIEAVLDDAFEGMLLDQQSEPDKESKSTKSLLSDQAPGDEEANEAVFIEKMKAIHDHFRQHADEPMEDPMLDEIMNAFGEDGANSSAIDGQLDSLMSGIMEEMLSKQVLYEPLKELHSKYPAWIAAHKNHSNIEDYKKQFAYLEQIIRVFENPQYEAVKDSKEVEELVNKLQELGNPPEEMLRDAD